MGSATRVYLSVYLNDHRAGAAAGLARAQRAAKAYRGSPLGDAMKVLAAQLQSDAESLDRVVHELSVPVNPLKRAIAVFGEQIGRLKLNGRLLGTSPLSPVLELELLMAGIDAKRSLWRSLQAGDVAVPGVDLDELVHRAGKQRTMLRPHHRDAACAAFASDAAHAPSA